MTKKLLLNFVYCNPAGHVIEAIKFARGYYDANKDLEVHLLLNKRMPCEIARACDWIKKIYEVDAFRFYENENRSPFSEKIAKTWDFVVTDERAINCYGMEPPLAEFHRKFKDYFKAKEWKGYTNAWYHGLQPDFFKYKPDSKVTLKLPKEATEYAKRYNHKGEKICIMLGGSASAAKYPSINAWIKIIDAINNSFKNPKIFLTGVRKSNAGRTSTRAYADEDIQKLLNKFKNSVDCYDIGLWNQVSLMQKCDVFIAPHTGFAFLAPCVGTPWLALSGNEWPEFLFNKTPFYSVLPDCRKYPCYKGIKKTCTDRRKKGKQDICMSDEQLSRKTDEIIKGIRLLLDKSYSYNKAMTLHCKKIRNSNINKKDIFSFDRVIENTMNS